MASRSFEELREELKKGASNPEHPFRYFTMGTASIDALPRLRTIVLRDFTEDLELIFFTDKRSKKMIHLKENNKVGLLFYNPEKKLQVRIEGITEIIKDEKAREKYWPMVGTALRKEYATAEAPGSELKVPENIDYLQEGDHFCVVKVIPFKIEYLRLGSPHHLRVFFSWEEDQWEKEYLVP